MLSLSADEQSDLARRIRQLVRGGFATEADIREECEEYLWPRQWTEAERSWLHEQIASIWAEKRAAEAAWPADTDFDRLDRVFRLLGEAGFIALHCAGNTQSDGWDDTREEWDERGGGTSGIHGAIFYHGQDVDQVIEDGTLYLTYGPMPGSRLTAMQVAHRAVEVLTAAGFSVKAPPDDTLRIEINGLDWKKSSPT